MALLPRRPLLAWRIATVATLVNLPVEVAPDGLSWPWHPLQVLILPAMVLFVAVRQPAATIFWTALLTAAAMAPHLSAAQAPVVVAFVALFAVVGDQIRRRVEAQHDLTTERRLTQVEQARRAVLEERARISVSCAATPTRLPRRRRAWPRSLPWSKPPARPGWRSP